jgi:hypothetical protein
MNADLLPVHASLSILEIPLQIHQRRRDPGGASPMEHSDARIVQLKEIMNGLEKESSAAN